MRLPIQKARKIAEIRRSLIEDAKFYLDEERKLIREYADKDEFAEPIIRNGAIIIQDNADKDAFIVKREELRNMEIAFEFDSLHIADSEIGNQPISGEDIENLSPFITFGGE